MMEAANEALVKPVLANSDVSIKSLKKKEKETEKEKEKTRLCHSHTEDPFNLHKRFIRTHLNHYSDALDEIRRGRKCSCWMWFIFPTPPWIVRGMEMGSGTNMHYALRTDEQAKAYLRFEASGVNLRANYIEITTVVRDQLKKGIDVVSLFGFLDAPKLRSSIAYFEKIGGEMGDEELRSLCASVMELLNLEHNREKKPTFSRFGYSMRRGMSSSSSSSSSSSDEEEDDDEKKKKNR
jgi:uncharacterized protein (DUF1810 family)